MRITLQSFTSVCARDYARWEGVCPINIHALRTFGVRSHELLASSRDTSVLTMMRPVLLALALTSLVPTPSHAQFTERVQTGTRVRVWIPEAYPQEQGPWRRLQLRATVAGVSDDTLRLTVPGTFGALVVPRSAIRRLDVSKGPPSRVASAVERAFGFAVAGAISAAISNNPEGTEWPNYNRTWRAAEEGAGFGAALGAVVGFVFPTERWRRVRLQR